LRSAERVEWRLGFLSRPELDRALSDATIALFPYRAELDQSGALLRALGAGRVVPAGDVAALADAVRELLEDPAALAAARAGADRARRELTWDAAAAQHLALYREIA